MRTVKATSSMFFFLASLCAVMSVSGAIRAEDADSPVGRTLGDQFAADIDRVLAENGIRSVAVFGFISQDGKDTISEAANGLLPNEMAKVLNMRLTNLRKYKVMPTGLVAGRRRVSRITIETLEDKTAVQTFLGDEYEVMVYGYVTKDLQLRENQVKVQFTLLKIINGEVVPLKMEYGSYKVGDDPGTLAYLGENFPPLFITRPNGETNINPSGMLGGNAGGEIISAYICVDGKRLPFYKASETRDENLLAVKIPLDSEYSIELFDPNASSRIGTGGKNRLGAVVLVDGLNSIGNWSDGGGPGDEDFMLCDNPATATKWLLNGSGPDASDESGKAGKSIFIEGWQKSMESGRRFKFGKSRDSLAARTNQISANLGIITIVVFKESAGGGKGDYATGEGREFTNQLTLHVVDFEREPSQVINIRCIPVDAGDDGGELEEGLQRITR